MVLEKLLIILVLVEVKGHFLGGTISFRPIPRRNQIQLAVRTTWEKGKGPCGSSCSAANIGSSNPSSPFKNKYWTYGNGTDSPFNLNYVLTIVNDNISFEQGENRFIFPTPKTPILVLRLNSLLWTPTEKEIVSKNALLVTSISTSIRNDTRLPNSSPIVPLPPYTGVQFGCTSKIKIPATDPDDDLISCRWAEPNECGQACSNIPHATLDQKSCTIKLDVTSTNQYKQGQRYRVTLMIEDTPRHVLFVNGQIVNPGTKLSAIPLQFIVNVVNATGTCGSGMDFVPLTLPENERVPYPFNLPKLLNVAYLESSDVRNTKFLISGPKGCTYNQQPDDRGRQNVTRLFEECHFTPRDGIFGDTFICVWGLHSNGVTSQGRCVNIITAGRNECALANCPGNETCYNLFMLHTCRCANENRGPLCLPEPEDQENSGLPLMLIIAVSAGSLFLLVVILALTRCMYKWMQRSSKTSVQKLDDKWASSVKK